MGQPAGLVATDHHFLEVALSRSESAEAEALNCLFRYCPSRLVIDDSRGVLGGVYIELMGAPFRAIQAELLARAQSTDKLVTGRRRFPVASIPSRQVRYAGLLRAVLAIRPRYIMTRVDQWRNQRQRFENEYDLEILSAEQFTSRFP